MAGRDDLTRKEELMKAAVELFSTRGFKGTSVRDIASKVGISVSHMYHYFENKEDLWVATQEYSVRWLPERLEAVWQESSDPLERFKLLLREHLAMSRMYQKESRIFTMNQEHLSKKGNVKNLQSQQRVLDVYVKHIESLRDAGYVSTARSKILAFNILGVLNWYLRWYRQDGPLPAADVSNEIIGFILYGSIGKINAAENVKEAK